MSNSSVQARVLCSPEAIRRLTPEWQDLWTRCPGASTFQRPEWLLAWMKAFHPLEIRLFELRRDSHLVGIAPLLIYPRGDEQVLAFMGGGVSDYLDLLVDPEWVQLTVEAFRDAILEDSDWRVLDLTDLPSDTVLSNSRLWEFQQPHDICSAIRLPAASAELLQMFSNRQRANLRNAKSRLNHSGGGEIELATAETISEFTEELFQLHTGRWAELGSPGVLSDEKVRVFHREITPRLLDRGCLRVYRLRSADRTLAVIETFFEPKTAFCYMQGFDPDSAYLSPGTQLMFAVINEAVRAGLRKFDFLRGTETYKSHWRGKPEQTYRISASREQLTSINRRAA